MFYPTLLHDYFDESARKFPQKEALIFEDQRYTHVDIYNRANILADKLIDLGLKKQDRVMIYMDNAPEAVISFYAALKAGGIFTIINSAVQVQKLSYIIGDCKPAVIIADTKKEDNAIQAVKDNQHSCKIIWTGSEKQDTASLEQSTTIHWNTIFTSDLLNGKNYEPRKLSAHRVLDIDLAGLVYTSGSTGEPKGVMESHYNIISASRSIIQYLDNTPDDIILNTLPLSFDYGLYQVIMSLMFGGTGEIIHFSLTNPEFNKQGKCYRISHSSYDGGNDIQIR